MGKYGSDLMGFNVSSFPQEVSPGNTDFKVYLQM